MSTAKFISETAPEILFRKEVVEIKWHLQLRVLADGFVTDGLQV